MTEAASSQRPSAPSAIQSAAAAVATSREAGSAYVTVLLVLVVLTAIGLALTLVTQTELQIGANERSASRTFYAADSGVGVAVAKVLVTNDHSASRFLINDNLDDGGRIALDDVVRVTPMVPILQVPCNLCQINQGSDFYYMNHAVTSTATRESPLAGTPLAEQTVTVMVGLQPWQPSAQSLAELENPEVLSKIRF